MFFYWKSISTYATQRRTNVACYSGRYMHAEVVEYCSLEYIGPVGTVGHIAEDTD